MGKGSKSFYNRFVKRALDIVISILVLTVFCWLYFIIAVLVYVKHGAPVIFAQDRPGKIDNSTGREIIFSLYKFRSMTNERDENGVLLPNEKRLTKFGRILRATSLDELPEFWNILKGDMSLVGPRPLLVKYLDRYSTEQHRRHEVRPGLTGYAQVNGRNGISWEEKFRMDIEYVDNVSFMLDVKILLTTVVKVLRHEGIDAAEGVTMEEFMGSGK